MINITKILQCVLMATTSFVSLVLERLFVKLVQETLGRLVWERISLDHLSATVSYDNKVKRYLSVKPRSHLRFFRPPAIVLRENGCCTQL